jgi:hypothetical protein
MELIAKLSCAVPGRNHSLRAASSCAPKRHALRGEAGRGGSGARLGVRACSCCITAAQIGAAPLVPLTSCMAAPLALPTHTPTV